LTVDSEDNGQVEMAGTEAIDQGGEIPGSRIGGWRPGQIGYDRLVYFG
jgi:hypothetical protein